MFEFIKECIITGVEQRTKKDNSTYILVHALGDNGVTVSCMYKGDANKVYSLNKMEKYEVTFQINVGQYTHLNIQDIKIG